MPRLPKNAFTLVELLVVISIISILSVIGLVVFTNIQKSARDSKRRADINSISKAYEVKYSSSGQYQQLSDDDFSSGKTPTTPEGGTYQYVAGPDALNSTLSGFLVCAALDGFSGQCNGSPSQTVCFCRSSTQGSLADGPGGDDGGGGVATCPSIPDLAGYWKMDEGAGNTASDSSGNGNSASLKNGVTWDLGKVYGAVKLDGSDDFTEVGSSVFDVSQTTAWTISAWIKPSTTSGPGTIVAISTSLGNFIYLHRITNVLGWWVMKNAATISRQQAATGIFSADNWYHVVLTGNPIVAYVNGSTAGQTATAGYDSPPNVFNRTWFGRIFTPDVSLLYSGLLDEVRIYTRALDSSEINALYNSGAGCTN